MEKGMPFYTDDRTILITAEFWESGYLLRNGKSCIQRFELDLILRDDITLDQLIVALHHGVTDRLERHYGVTPSEDDIEILYEDHYVHDPGGTVPRDFEEYHEDDPELGTTPEQREINSWLICWKLIQECSQAYLQGYAETQDIPHRAAVFPPHMPHHPVIACGSIDLNAWRRDEVLSVSSKSQIWLDQKRHGAKTLRELGFVSSSRLIFDPAMWHRSDVLFDDAVSNCRLHWPTPVYQSGTQNIINFDGAEVHIVAPPEPSKPQYAGLIPAIITPLLMTGAFVGIGSVIGAALSSKLLWILAGTTIAATGLACLIAWAAQRYAYHMELKLSCADYQSYIRKTLAAIRERQKSNAQYLRQSYPPVLDGINGKDLVHMAQSSTGDLFSRMSQHPDFLRVRIGLSQEDTVLTPNRFPINGEIKSQYFSGLRYRNIRNHPAFPFTIVPPVSNQMAAKKAQEDARYLSDLPADIARHYGYLANAPVLLDIGNSRAIGLLLQNSQATPRPFIANLMLDLCFHHSPADIQVLMFLKPTHNLRSQQEAIRFYKHLPHCRQLLKDTSPFAFDTVQARRIMDRVYHHLESSPQGRRPHILLIMEEDLGLYSHPLSQYLPACEADAAANTQGITFLACSDAQLDLPRFCAQTIKVTAEGSWFLLPFQQVYTDGSSHRYAFRPDDLPYRFSAVGIQDEGNLYFRAFKTISAMSCRKFGQNDTIPMTDFFQLLEEYGGPHGIHVQMGTLPGLSEDAARLHRENQLKRYSQEMFKRSQSRPDTPLSTLAVPVGKSSTGITTLDLHANAGGPHALIFGDNATGKTELLLTYIRSLCLHYQPHQILLTPVDVMPGGLNDRMGSSPYISPLFSKGTDMEHLRASDIAQRLVSLLDTEIYNRSQLLKNMGAASIDAYNLALQDLRHHALHKLHMTPENAKLWINKFDQDQPLPHRFLILDNFHQMQQLLAGEQRYLNLGDELMQMLAGCGHLGIHLVLATEQLDPQRDHAFLAGFQTRICLKTTDMDAAAAVVGVSLPAEPFFPGDGRACLWCKADPRMEHFQVSYPDSDHSGKPIRITWATPDGYYELFYDSTRNYDTDSAQSQNQSRHSNPYQAPMGGQQPGHDPGHQSGAKHRDDPAVDTWSSTRRTQENHHDDHNVDTWSDYRRTQRTHRDNSNLDTWD